MTPEQLELLNERADSLREKQEALDRRLGGLERTHFSAALNTLITSTVGVLIACALWDFLLGPAIKRWLGW